MRLRPLRPEADGCWAAGHSGGDICAALAALLLPPPRMPLHLSS